MNEIFTELLAGFKNEIQAYTNFPLSAETASATDFGSISPSSSLATLSLHASASSRWYDKISGQYEYY